MPLVLDASVTLSWYLPDERSGYARRALRHLDRDRAVVPAIWALEVANGLLVAERRKRVTANELVRIRQMLAALPITITQQPALDTVLGDLLDIARSNGLSAYDASYVYLAQVCDIPLATQDVKLSRVCAEAGVRLFE